MPMHDWTRVEAGVYSAVHLSWLVAIHRVLNGGLLPSVYYALTERVTSSAEAEILPLSGCTAQGVSLRGSAGRLRQRIAVRRTNDHRVVAVIELVSPGSKEGRRDYLRFVAKSAAILSLGIHLLVIDPFAPPPHSPLGLHDSIWRRAVKRRKGKTPATLPADRPLMAAGYASGDDVVAAIQPFAVGDPVPDVPLYLTPEQEYVTLPLEPTYAGVFADVPGLWREVLEA